MTGASAAQYLTETISGRAIDYCSPDTFAGWEDLVRTTTTTNPAVGGFCITPATVEPGSPCSETAAVPTTGLDEEQVKREMTKLAIRFFTDKLARDRDGDGVADTADNCRDAANADQADADGDHAGNACDATPYGITPPTLTVPADTVANATGPSGALVSFSASATDDLDPSPSVVCTPATGSLFAIGATQVTYVATDNGGNQSPSAGFTVTVLGAGPQLSRLVANVVNSTGLSPAVKAQLTTALQSLLSEFDPARPLHRVAACPGLRTFTTVVRFLAPTHAAAWTADANQIRAVLACRPEPARLACEWPGRAVYVEWSRCSDACCSSCCSF